MSKETSKENMDAFRKARKVMGFTHTSAYVPSSRLPEFSIFVERLKAERMLEICAKSLPTSGERIALANRNVVDVPTPTEVRVFLEKYPHQPAVKEAVKRCVESLELSNSSLNVAKLETDYELQVKYTSLGVAHNYMASTLWRELLFMTSMLEPANG